MAVLLRGASLTLAGMLGPLLFTTLVVMQGLLQPDYSHVRLPISALAAWPLGWVQNLNFYLTGTLLMAFALGIDRAVHSTPLGRLGVGLLMLSGVGVVLAGVFPWRMIDGVPTETPAHVVGAITAFASSGLGLVLFSRRMRRDAHWQHLARYTMVTGVLVLILFVTIGFFAIDDGTPLHAWAGLLQRTLCAVWFACLIALSNRARTFERHAAAE